MSGLAAFPRPWAARLHDLTAERDEARRALQAERASHETTARHLDEERQRNAALELRLGGGGTSARDQAVPTPMTDGPPRGDGLAWVRRSELVQAAHRIHVLERTLEERGIDPAPATFEGSTIGEGIAAQATIAGDQRVGGLPR